MTRKKYRKLLQAHFTAVYLQNTTDLEGWIGKAYQAARDSRCKDYTVAFFAIKRTLPVV